MSKGSLKHSTSNLKASRQLPTDGSQADKGVLSSSRKWATSLAKGVQKQAEWILRQVEVFATHRHIVSFDRERH